jgi:hypothetical protein
MVRRKLQLKCYKKVKFIWVSSIDKIEQMKKFNLPASKIIQRYLRILAKAVGGFVN